MSAMTNERFLITGALGCIGAWVVRNLVREGVATAIFDRASDPRRLRLIMREDELAQITSLTGDITDFVAVDRAVGEFSPTSIIHLAALQVPFCKADPVLGAQVNVVGTVNVFEVAKRRGLGTTIAYASSAAVYDASGAVAPRTLYGVYKVANEGTARVYWQEDGVASV